MKNNLEASHAFGIDTEVGRDTSGGGKTSTHLGTLCGQAPQKPQVKLATHGKKGKTLI